MIPAASARRNAPELIADVLWGLAFSLLAAILFGAMAGFTFGLRAIFDIQAPGAKARLTFGMMLGGYLMAGAVAGVLVGLLRPWLERWWGRTVIGAAVGPAFGIAVGYYGLGEFSVPFWIAIGIPWGMLMAQVFR